MKKTNIHIHIDSIDLQGVDPRHGERVTTSLRQELASLIAQHGIPESWMRGGVVTPGPMPRPSLSPGRSPEQLGAGVARAIYRGGNQ